MAEPLPTADVPMAPDDPRSPPVSVKAEDVASVSSKRTRDHDREEQVRADLARAEEEMKEAKEEMKEAKADWRAKGMPEEGIFARRLERAEDVYKAAVQRVNTAQDVVKEAMADLVAERAAKRVRQGHPSERAGALPEAEVPPLLRPAVPYLEAPSWRRAGDEIHEFARVLREVDPDNVPRLEEKGAGATIGVVDLPSWPLFEGGGPDKLFVRPEALECWQRAWKARKKFAPRRNSKGEGVKIVVTGDPGMGKSRSMTLCLAMALRADRDVDGAAHWRPVVYENREGHTAYAFLPVLDAAGAFVRHDVYECKWSEGKAGDPLANVTLRQSTDAVTFVDTDNALESPDERYRVSVLGTAYLAASPNTKRFRAFSKNKPGEQLVMAPWLVEELAAVRPHFESAGISSVDALADRVAVVGPSIRYVLNENKYNQREKELLKTARKLEFDVVKAFVSGEWLDAGDRSSAVLGYRRLPEDQWSHYVKGDKFSQLAFRLQPVSPLVASILATRFANRLLDQYARQEAFEAACMGTIFELLAILVLSAGMPMKCRKLLPDGKSDDKAPREYTLGAPREYTLGAPHMFKSGEDPNGRVEVFFPQAPTQSGALDAFRDIRHPAQGATPKLGVPVAPNQPVLDAFTSHGVAFQMTQAATHPISGPGLEKIASKVGAIKLVFVVPWFVERKYTEPQKLKKGASAAATAKLQEAKQYVMSVDRAQTEAALKALGERLESGQSDPTVDALLRRLARRTTG